MVSIRLMVAVSAIIGLAIGGLVGSYLTGLTSMSREDELNAEIKKLQTELGLSHVEGEVYVYSWSSYINPYVIDLFEKAYGVHVTYNTFESDEEVWTKVSTNATGYDVVVMADAWVGMAIRDHYIEPLNRTLIPNMEYIDPKFTNQFYDPGNKYSVPYMWGTTGIGYDSSLVKDNVTGWAQLFDFSKGGFLEKYKKKITMLDDLYETIPAALKYLNYSTNDVNQTHLEQAQALLIKQKPYLLDYATADTYITDMTDPQASGYWICHCWSGDLYSDVATNPNLRFVLPKEGGVWWIDNMMIPNGASHPIAAHAWINFMTDPLVSAINSQYIGYASPNQATVANLLPQSVVSEPGMYPSVQELAKFELGRIYTDEERLRLEAVWTAVKSA
jgi:spermidine/putrescine transport system substrate-binding protein